MLRPYSFIYTDKKYYIVTIIVFREIRYENIKSYLFLKIFQQAYIYSVYISSSYKGYNVIIVGVGLHRAIAIGTTAMQREENSVMSVLYFL